MSCEKIAIYREQPDAEDIELVLKVYFDYSPAARGFRDRYGAPLTPDESEYLCIEEAFDANTGEEVELTQKEQDEIEEELWNIIGVERRCW